MSFTTLTQHLLTGISLGGAYALIAIGYTMVYGILRLINFAHGDIFMMAGYFMIFAMASFPWFISIPIVLIGTVLLGVTIEKVAYKPLLLCLQYNRMPFSVDCRWHARQTIVYEGLVCIHLIGYDFLLPFYFHDVVLK